MKATITGLILALMVTVQGNSMTLVTGQNKTSENTLWINDLYADLEIIGTSGSEIKIKAFGYEGLPEKAKGLKPLGGGGEENTGIGLSFNPSGNKISLSSAHNVANDAKYIISLPKNMKLVIEDQGWRGGDILIKGLENEVEAKTQVGDLIFEDVSGPIVAHTLSSDLKVIFTSLKQVSPSSISSTSGDIDVTLPASAKGTFTMRTTSGGVYTDMDFDLGEEGRSRRITGQSAIGKLNGGGVEVTLRSVSGDIYVRKAN